MSNPGPSCYSIWYDQAGDRTRGGSAHYICPDKLKETRILSAAIHSIWIDDPHKKSVELNQIFLIKAHFIFPIHRRHLEMGKIFSIKKID